MKNKVKYWIEQKSCGKELETEDLAHDVKKQRIMIWCFAAFRKSSSNHQGTLLLDTSLC